MFDLRAPIVVGAAPAGLLMGALVWMLFGGGTMLVAPVQALEADFNALPTRAHTPSSPYGPDPVAQAIAMPLFATTAVVDTAPDVPVRVVGLASTPERKAALLSINNAPAEWVELGATRSGVTVRELNASKVTLETSGGLREVALGESSTPSPAPAPGQAPGGYRMPPAPASAPGVRR